jgi:hypothetical protein
MAITIKIYDGFSPMLDEIGKIHYGMAMDALDQSANHIRKKQREAIGWSGSHHWRQKVVDGKRRIYRGSPKAVGSNRMSHSNGSILSPSHMKNFINSWVSEKHMMAVVGGRHKSYRPSIWRDGKRVGRGSKVSGVSEKTFGILQKLNDGGTYKEQSSYYKKTRDNGMDRFKNANFKARRFMQKGRSIAMPRVRDIMTKKLEMLIGKQINRTQVKTKVVA